MAVPWNRNTGRVGGNLMVNVLTFLPGLAMASLVLYFRARLPLTRWLLILLTVPAITGFVSAVFRWRISRVIALLAVISYWGISGMFFVLGSQGFGIFFFMLVPLLALLLVAIPTTILSGTQSGFLLTLSAAAAGFLFGIGATSIQHTSSEATKHVYSRARDPLPLGPDMMLINKCAHLYYLSHPKVGFPESLQQLGPKGVACLPVSLLNGKDKGFSIDYQPGADEASGKVAGYTIKAEEASPHGTDFSSMSSDESGLVLYKFEGPLAKGSVYAYSPVASSFEYLIGCLRDGMTENKSSAKQADESVQACWRQSRLGNGYTIANGRFTSKCFNITFKFGTNASGVIDRFNAIGQPAIYGDCGIRSYLIEAAATTLRMYATAENRPATRSDPLAKMCELKDPGDCGKEAKIN